MRAAILNDRNEVENIIVADLAFCQAHYAGRFVMLGSSQYCDLGWVWDGKVFKAPA